MSTGETEHPREARPIEYLSAPMAVSMTDAWYELASLDHFWIQRRFSVLQSVAGSLITGARAIAEIGCGHGLLQRQMEDTYGCAVDGFDLNEFALRQSLSRSSRVCCYDIHQRNESLRARYDLIFLFDVLEHIDDEQRFLQAVLFHLQPEGRLIINVPAGEWLFSEYDRVAGHIRRYSIRSLRECGERSQVAMRSSTYWGLPLIPLLLARKIMLLGHSDQRRTIQHGFGTRNRAINLLLRFLSRCEPIPQILLGTSILAVFSRGETT